MIPPEGLVGLQHHFFAQQLVDYRKAAGKEFEEALCEVCSEESDEGAIAIPAATVYCADCNQKLCDRYSRPHRR